MDDERMKCICCNEEKEVLISVVMKKDSIFGYRMGVCQDCIKNEDINKVCEEFEIRKTKESIKEMEGSLKNLKEQLAKFGKGDDDGN